MRKTRSQILAVFVLLGIALVGFRAHSVLGADSFGTTFGLSNLSPIFTATPSDGGSSASAPTSSGSDVTFTATANDANSDQYYLAICKTNAVTPGANTYPTCDGGKWPSANPTAFNSDSMATETYTAQSGDAESNAWYAFVCDKRASGAACYPANAAGDQGLALGTVTFIGVPEDGDAITVDSITYEFDTANNGIVGGRTEADTSQSGSVADAASALAIVEAGASSHMVARGAAVTVYADSPGAGGNSIGLSEPNANEGGSTNEITLSGSTLAGGSAVNSSPFAVNPAPTFGTVLVGSATGGTGAIVPGSTVYFHLNANGGANGIDDTATDTVRVYICDPTSTGVNLGTNVCTGGSAITYCAQSTPFDPNTVPFECSKPDLTPIPTLNGAYGFKIFVYDSSALAGTGTNLQSYTVQDTVPVAGAYTVSDIVLSTGVSVNASYTVIVMDNNGGSDLTGATAVLYDSNVVTLNSGTCVANEKNCYSVACVAGTPSGISLTYTCDFPVWFNANSSLSWKMHINPTDETNSPTNLSDSDFIIVGPISAIGTEEAGIDYTPSSSLTPGSDSVVRTLTLTNQGNLVIDVKLYGTAMTSGVYSIAAAQQKFHETSNTFGWADTPTAAGPYVLQTSAGVGDESLGCLNRDIAVRTVHDSTSLNEAIYWRLRAPSPQKSGVYSGTSTVSASSANTCTGTLY